jgi:hypothetical protein
MTEIATATVKPGTGETLDSARDARLLKAYDEVCRSYHAIDEFRTKLLGILPISSLAGILLLGKDNLFTGDGSGSQQQLVGFASFFATAFTLALFLFEIRGILRCHYLIQRGADLERDLHVRGQFDVCTDQHASDAATERIFNAKVAASAVYSLVFSAWLFMALRFTFGLHIVGCGLTATILGGVLAVGTHHLVSKRVAA